jgi:WD40 repeat protein
MSERRMSERSIFLSAIDKSSADERSAFLAEVCAGDPKLRADVEALLVAHGNLGAIAPATVDESARRRSTVIGDFKLLEQIGAGGMGEVWMAEQQQPVRRKVAVKLIKAEMNSRQVLVRFEAERQALALMDHPNIAKVLDAGNTDADRPYFVMELVKGLPITKYCDEHRLTPRQRLELFLPVCQAVQHAHQKGIIHRDLKPSNVMVAQYDGKPVPKVIDFGVAKAMGQKLTEATLFTHFGQVVGTLEYMSPEQAELNQLDIDTRSDIYSLGVMLYELLTGTTPLDRKRHKDMSFMEVLRMIREDEPPRPSTRLSTTAELPAIAANRGLEPKKLSGLLRGELDWIVMKSLEKDRNRRYETANAFALDLQRHLADEPVQACPPSAAYRFRKFARRNAAALLAASAIVLAVAFAGALSTVLIWRANQHLQLALENQRRDAYFQRITVAYRELSANNLRAALRVLEECPTDLRGWEWHYLMRLCRVGPFVIHAETEVNGVAFGPRGNRLVAACGDGTIRIWDSKTGGAPILSFSAHDGAVLSVVFHQDGKHVASRGADRKIKIWDLSATEHAVWTEPCSPTRPFGTAYSIAFSPDGRLLAAGTDDVVNVWDWNDHRLLHSLPEHNFHSIPVAFSGDGRLATGTFREGLKIWDPTTGALLRVIPSHFDPVTALAFSNDGKWLASASLGRSVKLTDSATGAPGSDIDNLHTGNVECVAFSPNGRLIASGGEDKTVRVWDAATGREILGLEGHADRCSCVAFSPDGLRLVSASSDKTIQIWDGSPLQDNEHGQEILTFSGHSDEIRSVAVSPNGLWVASAGTGGRVKVWDPRTGRASAEFLGHREFSGRKAPVFCVAWHPGGNLIASAGLDTVRVWDIRTQREQFNLPVVGKTIPLPYCAVAFSPDGQWLVTGNSGGALQIWDGANGKFIATLDTEKREIRGVVFSRDGKHLASESSSGVAKLWDARQLENQFLDGSLKPRIDPILARVAGPGLSIAYSPDGRWLVTAGDENTVRIWDVDTGREVRPPFRGHTGDIYAVAVSPNGRWIASGGEDSTVKVWDSHTGTLVRNFRGHMGVVSSLAFSSNDLLISGSRDRTAMVWDLKSLSDPPARQPKK